MDVIAKPPMLGDVAKNVECTTSVVRAHKSSFQCVLKNKCTYRKPDLMPTLFSPTALRDLSACLSFKVSGIAVDGLIRFLVNK